MLQSFSTSNNAVLFFFVFSKESWFFLWSYHKKY